MKVNFETRNYIYSILFKIKFSMRLRIFRLPLPLSKFNVDMPWRNVEKKNSQHNGLENH